MSRIALFTDNWLNVHPYISCCSVVGSCSVLCSVAITGSYMWMYVVCYLVHCFHSICGCGWLVGWFIKCSSGRYRLYTPWTQSAVHGTRRWACSLASQDCGPACSWDSSPQCWHRSDLFEIGD